MGRLSLIAYRVSMLLLLWPAALTAQQVLSVEIHGLPDDASDDAIYLSGNFNGWDPAEETLRLQRLPNGRLGLSIRLDDVPGDRVEFKFTRGDWKRSECTAAGQLIGPRWVDLHRDTLVHCIIEGWRDDFPASTASPNVHLLDSAFYMPQLDRHRRIWIYLPSDYGVSSRRYPVIYMQDGQHLFDEATSQGRIGPIEWAVDETIDQAANPCIVVAINHQDDYRDREPETLFHPTRSHPRVEGGDFLRFVVETLKPYVDEHYRTLPDRRYTGVAGSSLGGLLSLYAGLHYPETFGLVGVFSPSIWMDEGNLDQDLKRMRRSPQRLVVNQRQHYYFYAGQQENRRKADGTFVRMFEDTNRTVASLRKNIQPASIAFAVNPEGRHGALYWRHAFPDFYRWFSERTAD